MANPKVLHIICAHCGAPCHYVKQDRVQIGPVSFIERLLTCTGCGSVADLPAYFLSSSEVRRLCGT